MTSGSERRQRQARLTIRFSREEQSALAQAATLAGLSVSSYARHILVGAKPLRAARRPPVEKALLARTLGQLGKIGSNINQIAHVLNASVIGFQPPLRFDADLARALMELGQARGELLKALGRKAGPP